MKKLNKINGYENVLLAYLFLELNRELNYKDFIPSKIIFLKHQNKEMDYLYKDNERI